MLTRASAAVIKTEEIVNNRNRIINGDMRIDQRNAGAAVTADGAFPVDRYKIQYSMDGVVSAQQDTSAPAGFVNSTKLTVTTADASLGTSQFFLFRHFIEGTNISDLAWGSASAKTITLSFWVRSSLTGTFGGSLNNSANTRSYPFTYTISAADTWEQKNVTIAGDTSGTWLTTTGVGIRINWSIGAGTDFLATAGSWVGAEELGATGQTNVLGTLNATWYITGVQLEVGSVATPFERRPYGMELSLCQRYYWLAVKGANKTICTAAMYSATQALGGLVLPVTMRATPTLDIVTGTNYYSIERDGAADTFDSFVIYRPTENIAGLFASSGVSGTAGHAGLFECKNAASFIAFTSEL